MKRKIIFYCDDFLDFYSNQAPGTKKKIDFVLDLIRNIERVPSKFLKYLEGTDGLYEIKVPSGNKNVRIFCFFDEGRLVILINCFYKKTNKTPKYEIARAEKIKNDYFSDKLIRDKK